MASVWPDLGAAAGWLETGCVAAGSGRSPISAPGSAACSRRPSPIESGDRCYLDLVHH